MMIVFYICETVHTQISPAFWFGSKLRRLRLITVKYVPKVMKINSKDVPRAYFFTVLAQ